MKMIEPPPPSIISGMAARLSRNAPVRLTSMTCCHSPRLVSWTGPPRSCGAAPRDRPRPGGGRQPRGLRRRRRVDVGADDRGALFGEGEHDRPADRAAGAADQRRFALKLHPRPHSMTVPPSTAMVWPVTKPLASE